jgi:hypothetical protein
MAFVSALVRHFLPGLSEPQYEAILTLRGKVATPDAEPPSVLHDPAYATTLDAMLPEDEVDSYKSLAKQQPAATPAPSACGASASSSSSCAAAAPSVPVGPPKRVPTPSAMDSTFARQFIPLCPGSSISEETKRYGRWCGEYMAKPVAPKHCTKLFGDEHLTSKREALLHVLRFIWSAHEEVTGERRPWDLSS